MECNRGIAPFPVLPSPEREAPPPNPLPLAPHAAYDARQRRSTDEYAVFTDPIWLVLQIATVLAVAVGLGHGAKRLGLPSLLGMIVGGALAANAVFPYLPAPEELSLSAVSSPGRLVVLAIVLLRAGLGLSRNDLRQAGGLAVGLGIVPMLGDAALVTVGGVLLLDLSLGSALALGFLVAAISPAIVIPGMIDLLGRRSGGARRVPTALLAGAPLDNIAAVAALGIVLDVVLSGGTSLAWTLARIPWSIGGGLAFGVTVGWLLVHLVRRLGGPAWAKAGIVWVTACGLIPLSGSMGVSFVIAILCVGVTIRAIDAQLTETLSPSLASLWGVAQVVLFGFIGAALDLGPLAQTGLAALAIILLGQLGRAASVFVVTHPARLRWRERWACVCSYLPKATIQAAFAGLPLDRGLADGAIMLSTAILAVVVMAPVGVVALRRGADRLLP